MKRALMVVVAGVVLPIVAGAAVPAARAPVSIRLPGDLGSQFKPGPGSELALAHCMTCHSAAYVSTQPVLDKDHWVAEVNKMRKAYGAPIPESDVDAIATYLAKAYGPPAPAK